MSLLHQLTIAVSILGGIGSVAAALLSRPSAAAPGGVITVTIEDGSGSRVRTCVPSARRAEDVRSALDEALRRVA